MSDVHALDWNWNYASARHDDEQLRQADCLLLVYVYCCCYCCRGNSRHPVSPVAWLHSMGRGLRGSGAPSR